MVVYYPENKIQFFIIDDSEKIKSYLFEKKNIMDINL